VAGDGICPLYVNGQDAHDGGDGHDHGHHHPTGKNGCYADPHWWHSIANVELVACGLRDALIAADPDGRATYEANAKAFTDRLEVLAKWARLQVASLPKDRRILVTSHEALGYFARDYGFEIRPVQGVSTADQPSSQKVRALIRNIQADGVPAIFAENIENPKVLEQITKETGAKLGGVLYSDGLGTGDAGTYEGMVRHNVTTIVSALR
jgi:zinc/manganese transport system substrate-binding protein